MIKERLNQIKRIRHTVQISKVSSLKNVNVKRVHGMSCKSHITTVTKTLHSVIGHISRETSLYRKQTLA